MISADGISPSPSGLYFSNKVEELTQTVSMMDSVQLDRILGLMENARTVQLVAVGNTIPVALDGAFKFNQLGINAVSGNIWGTQMAFTCNLRPADVVIIISNSGFSKRLMTLMAVAKENQCKTVAITNHETSPLGQACDYHITTATRERLHLTDCYTLI